MFATFEYKHFTTKVDMFSTAAPHPQVITLTWLTALYMSYLCRTFYLGLHEKSQ